jgi:hypothetical protein
MRVRPWRTKPARLRRKILSPLPPLPAGEVITGNVVVQINSPRQCDRVLLKVSVKEVVAWDEEIVRSYTEGEGDNKRTRTVYEHNKCEGKTSHIKHSVVISQVPHILMPGAYKYPFQFPIPGDKPGVADFHRETEATDPSWRSVGHKLHARGRISYRVSAFFDVNNSCMRGACGPGGRLSFPRFLTLPGTLPQTCDVSRGSSSTPALIGQR